MAPNSQRLRCEMARAGAWDWQTCKRLMSEVTTASCKRKLNLLQGDERARAGREALQGLHCSRLGEASAPGSSGPALPSSGTSHPSARNAAWGGREATSVGFSTPHKTFFLPLFGGFATRALTQTFFPFSASRSGLC